MNQMAVKTIFRALGWRILIALAFRFNSLNQPFAVLLKKERSTRLLSKGDLLLEKSGGGETQPVGCVVIYNDDRPAVCSNFVARMQLAPGMNSSYWRYVHAAAYAIRLTTGSINQTSGIQNLDADRYFNERAAFPTLPEQQAIATFLDIETAKIDGLMAEQRALVALLKEKRQAVISHAVTKGLNPAAPMKDSGVTWLGEVPGHWEVKKDVLAAFKDYHTTAELANVTDPNLVYDLRAKLDGAGYYDDFEVNRVVVMDTASNQGTLVAAISPVADRVVKRFKAAQELLRTAQDKKDTATERTAKDDMDALDLFKHDLGTFSRAYAFLSQMFNYGNTDIEKRAIFYKLLLPLLEFNRERDGVDLSKLALTHHTVRNLGKQALDLNAGLATKLVAMEPGGGTVQEKEKALLLEIINKVNDLFEGDLTDDDQLVYVNNVIKGKLLESEVLTQQASNNTKEQFSNSPDINHELINAFMDSQAAHIVMSQQALNSERVRDGIKRILLENCQLYEALRSRGASAPSR